MSMMIPEHLALRILALDTSTARASVALLEGKELRAEVRLQSLHTHSTNLLASIDFLLRRMKWNLKDLDLVAVGNGPGSFTGIRIGVSTALGLARTLAIPFVEIAGLDALAHSVSVQTGRIGVILNAHRSQAYYAEYAARQGKIRAVQKAALVESSAREQCLRGRPLYLVGDTDLCGFGEPKPVRSHWPHPIHADPFRATAIGRLALERRRKWRRGGAVLSEPTYIRPPDAIKKKHR